MDDNDGPTIYSGFMVMNYDPSEDVENWGFQYADEPRIIHPTGKGGRWITYVNTPFVFLNDATVRFLTKYPVSKENDEYYSGDKKRYFTRYDKRTGKEFPHIPYAIIADCQEVGWKRMALLPTVGFHKQIQYLFGKYDIEEWDVHNHLWKVFKGHKDGYRAGQWGIQYFRCDPWKEAEGPEYPGLDDEDSPWNTVPGAVDLRVALKERVLPHYPTQPREDIYVREIMERMGADYTLAKALYDSRRSAGLP
jgi:hypothetical protein